MEAELDKVKAQTKDKQKKIFEDASRKNGALQEAFEADRNIWKKKLDDALEENMAVQSEMFEKSQKHSAEMMDLRRLAQEKEDKAAIEERKLREEIREFIANLANERVTNNELKEKLQQNEAKSAKELEAKDKMMNDLKEKLVKSEGQGNELAQTLVQKEKMFIEKCQELETKENTLQESLNKLKSDFEAEKNALKANMEEQIQEKSQESSELLQEVGSYKEKVEQLNNDFNTERETLKTNFQKELQEHCTKQEERAKEIEQLTKQIETLKDQNAKEVEANTTKVAEQQQKLESEIQELQKKLEETSAPIKDLENSLEAMTEDRDKVVAELEKSKETFENKENELTTKISEIEDACKILKEKEQAVVRDEEETKALAGLIEKLEQENIELEDTLQEERATSRQLGCQINSLTAQVSLADRTIRDQKQAIEKIQNECTDAKKARQQIVIPREKVQQLLDDDSSTDDEPLMKIDELASGSSSTSLSSVNSDLTKSSMNSFSRSSLRSTIGGRVASSRRQSALYVKGNTPPTKRTTASAAFFMVGGEFAANEDEEPDYDYDWGRMAELDRRNTICKPHMKTSYPIETQTRPDENKTLVSSISESGYRTKLKRTSNESNGNGATESKLRKDQPNSKSEGFLKRSMSKKLTETMTSKMNFLRSRSKENVSKETEKQQSCNESLAFSIDITPPKKKSKEKKASKTEASQKEPKSSSKASLKDSMAFTIENSPPKNKKSSSELKPKRQRTINRSTASTRLVLEKDKEVCKETKKKEYLTKTNRKPLRTANKK